MALQRDWTRMYNKGCLEKFTLWPDMSSYLSKKEIRHEDFIYVLLFLYLQVSVHFCLHFFLF